MSTLGETDLGRMGYREAYARQQSWVERVIAGRASDSALLGHILLVEHDPVITVSNRPGAGAHVLASPASLAEAGVAVEPTDRGGDVTYHGPGQLVVYPIIDLNAARLRLHEYMRLLESVVIHVCATFGVSAQRDEAGTGVWVSTRSGDRAADRRPRKIAAMGVRVRRWVSMHGLAINVTTNLEHFDLIVPCGLAGREVTSLQAELGASCPTMDRVKAAVVVGLRRAIAREA